MDFVQLMLPHLPRRAKVYAADVVLLQCQATSPRYSQLMICLEDYPVGSTIEYPPFVTDEREIIEFARRYDAQPFHVDPIAASQSRFGGIIASGFHTCAMAMGSLVNGGFFSNSGMGSPGLDEIRWRQPVRGGQTLRVRTTILASTPSRSKPDRGTLKHSVELLNERNEVVMSFVANSMFPCRPHIKPT